MPFHDPPWVCTALRELGVKERPGASHSARILEYHGSTRLGADADEVPWCAAFVSWCLEANGFPSTRSAGARSYLRWGRDAKAPELGAVAVFARGREPTSGHVAFVLGTEEDDLIVVGGNQQNAVNIRRYPRASMIAMRMPLGFDARK